MKIMALQSSRKWWGLLSGTSATVVLLCTLAFAFTGRRAGRSNELLEIVRLCAAGGHHALPSAGQGQRMVLCGVNGAGSSLPAPYNYFTTPEVRAAPSFLSPLRHTSPFQWHHRNGRCRSEHSPTTHVWGNGRFPFDMHTPRQDLCARPRHQNRGRVRAICTVFEEGGVST